MANQKVKKLDALTANSIADLIEYMNKEGISKEEIVQIFCANGSYIAVLYK